MAHIPAGQQRWKMYSKTHFVWVAYNPEERKFIATGGGTYKLDGDTYIEHIDFFSEDASLVGQDLKFNIGFQSGRFHQRGEVAGNTIDEEWKRVENSGSKQSYDLAGLWRPVHADTVEGSTRTPHIPRGQVRWKMFTGTRFVWVAYNPEEKKFVASGGGTYSTRPGALITRLEFFSEDPSIAGKENVMKITLDGDRLHQSGVIAGGTVEEEWKRVE